MYRGLGSRIHVPGDDCVFGVLVAAISEQVSGKKYVIIETLNPRVFGPFG